MRMSLGTSTVTITGVPPSSIGNTRPCLPRPAPSLQPFPGAPPAVRPRTDRAGPRMTGAPPACPADHLTPHWPREESRDRLSHCFGHHDGGSSLSCDSAFSRGVSSSFRQRSSERRARQDEAWDLVGAFEDLGDGGGTAKRLDADELAHTAHLRRDGCGPASRYRPTAVCWGWRTASAGARRPWATP